jgi:hypothetical protein
MSNIATAQKFHSTLVITEATNAVSTSSGLDYVVRITNTCSPPTDQRNQCFFYIIVSLASV